MKTRVAGGILAALALGGAITQSHQDTSSHVKVPPGCVMAQDNGLRADGTQYCVPARTTGPRDGARRNTVVPG